MSENNNQQIINKAQTILKEFGYEIKLGHLYEMFSKLEGYKSWNVAKAKDVEFTNSNGMSAESKAVEAWWEDLKKIPLLEKIEMCLGPINHSEESPTMFQFFGPYVKGGLQELKTVLPNLEIEIQNSEFEVCVMPPMDMESTFPFLRKRFDETFVMGKPISDEDLNSIIVGLQKAAQAGYTLQKFMEKFNTVGVSDKIWGRDNQFMDSEFGHEYVRQAIQFLLEQ
jgi:hypothetical protein